MTFALRLLFANRRLRDDSLVFELKFFDHLISVWVICGDSRIPQNTLLSLALLLGVFALFAVVLFYLANNFELILQFHSLRERFLTLLRHPSTLCHRPVKRATAGPDANCNCCACELQNGIARRFVADALTFAGAQNLH